MPAEVEVAEVEVVAATLQEQEVPLELSKVPLR
jgi:hypothetical protein